MLTPSCSGRSATSIATDNSSQVRTCTGSLLHLDVGLFQRLQHDILKPAGVKFGNLAKSVKPRFQIAVHKRLAYAAIVSACALKESAAVEYANSLRLTTASVVTQ